MFHRRDSLFCWSATAVILVAMVPLYGQAQARKFRRVSHAVGCAKCDSPEAVTEYDSPVLVFAAKGQTQELLPGLYRANEGELQTVGNDSIVSVWAFRGFHVRLCEHEGDGNGDGACE